jgi:hypothetical protein
MQWVSLSFSLRGGKFRSIRDRYQLGAPIESDIPIPQNIPADQTSIVRLSYEIGRKDAYGLDSLQMCTRETDGTGVLTASVLCADCPYLGPVAGLKKLAVSSESLADYGDG